MTINKKLFVKYAQGNCYSLPLRIYRYNNIAKFLKLTNPNLNIEHCFLRSSAIPLTESGANILKIKLI